jgi:CubicO group peptidase (beta-lactamase class C family)
MLKLIAVAGLLAVTACAATPAATNTPAAAQVSAEWNAAALAEVVAYVQSQKTTGFLVIQDGKTIVEHNWPLPDDAGSQTFRANFVHGQAAGGALREDVASQQKSLIALLVGVGVDKGLIDIARPVSDYIGSRWSKATPEQEGKITVRHLLEMNSGLKEDLSFDAPAGTKFFYNTPAYAKLKPVLEKASGQDLGIVTQLWFTKVADMHSTGWEQRPAAFADSGNPTGLVTTPGDPRHHGPDHPQSRPQAERRAAHLGGPVQRDLHTHRDQPRLWSPVVAQQQRLLDQCRRIAASRRPLHSCRARRYALPRSAHRIASCSSCRR